MPLAYCLNAGRRAYHRVTGCNPRTRAVFERLLAAGMDRLSSFYNGNHAAGYAQTQ